MSLSAPTDRHSSESSCNGPGRPFESDVYSAGLAEHPLWVAGVIVSERAVKHVRKNLGSRLRALRKQRGLSQERLGEHAGLSGKFIGEVERGEKSISVDSLYRISVALVISLRELTDVRADKPSAVPSEDAEKIFALVSGRRRSADIGKAYRVLRAVFDKAS